MTDLNIMKCSVDEALSFIGVGKFQFKILLVTGFLWTADAIEYMILTFLLPIVEKEWNLSIAEVGAIGSAVFAGDLIGSLFWSNLSDRIGRKYCIISSNIGQLLFGILSAFSPNMYWLLSARFITGFFVGGSNCAYTLFAEFAPINYRGRLIILQQSFWAIGTTMNALIAWYSLEILNWRLYLIISSSPLLIILFFTINIPESVRYLITTNQIEKAQNILNNVLKQNNIKNTKILLVENEKNIIIVKNRGNFMEMFNIKYFKSTIVLLIISCCSVFSYYGISFLAERYFDEVTNNNNTDKYLSVFVTTAAGIPGVFIAMLVLDKYGRKNTIIVGFAIFSFVTFILMNKSIQNNLTWSIILSFLSRMSISISFGAIYVYYSEYYPTQIRNTALGISVAISRFAGMGATYVSAYDDFTYQFYLYALSGVIGFVCGFLIEYDTKEINMTNNNNYMEMI